jgi:hypothetical protein
MRLADRIGIVLAVCATAVLLAPALASSAAAQEPELKSMRISATAQGTSTQLGKMVRVDIIIREYSTVEDQQALFQAFQDGGHKGLARAVSKMSAKGRIAITGTLGYDINYIKVIDTPEGRKIRFVTDRAIRFGERWADTRSSDYDLSAGEIALAGEKGKTTGTLLPACQFTVDKSKGLEIELYQNPWKLLNVSISD